MYSQLNESQQRVGKAGPIISVYTSSPFLLFDYSLLFFCLRFTSRTVIFDNVGLDLYLTKDLDNGLGSERDQAGKVETLTYIQLFGHFNNTSITIDLFSPEVIT